jgi:serine/threonine-protein phosphatase 2B catalytic subunit
MDTFTWSLPFVTEKVIEMFYHILKGIKDEKIDEEEELDPEELASLTEEERKAKLEENQKILQNKVKFISKMLKMQQVLRENSETIIKIKSKYKNLPKGMLLEGPEGNSYCLDVSLTSKPLTLSKKRGLRISGMKEGQKK